MALLDANIYNSIEFGSSNNSETIVDEIKLFVLCHELNKLEFRPALPSDMQTMHPPHILHTTEIRL